MRAADNPFAVHRVLQVRYRLDDAGWSALLERLARADWRGAIVGPHGSGKTTLLEDLAERLGARGYAVRWLQFNAETPARLPRARWGGNDFVLCDGAEQLGAFDAMRLRWRTRRAAGLVVTAHDDRWQPVLHRCTTSPDLLRQLVSALGETISPSDCERLHARHGGNVREALREMYDLVGSRI